MPGVFRNPRTISAKIRNIRIHLSSYSSSFSSSFSHPFHAFTKLATLLLESSSVADPVRIDPHHFGMPDPQQKKSRIRSRIKAKIGNGSLCKWLQICII
jgi:hypothetical protein